jgi:hypothetical protein
MQLCLLVALPSLAQMSSLLLCGFIVGRVHYKMITTRNVMSMQTFNSVIISCASIQIVCKIIDNADLTAVSKIMQLVMSH